MKRFVLNFLKVAIPLGAGIFLMWYFYDAMNEEQKGQMFDAFKRANYLWVFISLVFGFVSHLSRSYRWQFLLEPMGYKTRFWNSYHAVMSAYLINYVIQRAGEAGRAGLMYKYEKVPFSKGFGTILAERAVDLIMLALIAVVTVATQLNKLDLFQEQIEAVKNSQFGGDALAVIGKVVVLLIIAGMFSLVILYIVKPGFRSKIKELARGFVEGLQMVVRTPKIIPFILHTFIIWGCYIAMFWVCFYALPETSDIPIAGVLAGFVAGSVGIILVQGGIGAYPLLVGLIISVYMPNADNGSPIGANAQALGYIIWVSQTIMIILLGAISLLLMPYYNKRLNNG